MRITYYAKSHKGKKSKENEDSYIVPVKNEIMENEPDLKRQGYLFAVCDGMRFCHTSYANCVPIYLADVFGNSVSNRKWSAKYQNPSKSSD